MKHLILLLVVLFVVACGKSDPVRPQRIVAYNSVSFSPLTLSSSQESCSTFLNLDFSNTPLTFFIENEYLHFIFDFSLLVDSENNLRSDHIISSTLYDYKEILNYNAYYNNVEGDWILDENSLSAQITKGSQVHFCENRFSYDADSIESAALNTNFVISRAYNKVKAAVPDLTLSPLTVSIAPLYGTVVKGENDGSIGIATQYQTDNAFYNPTDGIIAFLPQSKEGVEAHVFGGNALWNIPMVGAHEYGHHIFQHLFPEANSGEHSLCFDNRIKKGYYLHPSVMYEERVVGAELVFAAINEGFADLIAYYTLGDRLFSLKGISCMESTREVDSAYFADGTKKELSFLNVSRFFYPIQTHNAQTCFVPDFQDIHIMGATIASFIYQQLKEVDIEQEQSLKILIDWIKNIRQDYLQDNSRNEKEIFARSMTIFTDTLLKNVDDGHKDRVCSIVNSLYPESQFESSSSINPCGTDWW